MSLCTLTMSELAPTFSGSGHELVHKARSCWSARGGPDSIGHRYGRCSSGETVPGAETSKVSARSSRSVRSTGRTSEAHSSQFQRFDPLLEEQHHADGNAGETHSQQESSAAVEPLNQVVEVDDNLPKSDLLKCHFFFSSLRTSPRPLHFGHSMIGRR